MRCFGLLLLFSSLLTTVSLLVRCFFPHSLSTSLDRFRLRSIPLIQHLHRQFFGQVLLHSENTRTSRGSRASRRKAQALNCALGAKLHSVLCLAVAVDLLARSYTAGHIRHSAVCPHHIRQRSWRAEETPIFPSPPCRHLPARLLQWSLSRPRTTRRPGFYGFLPRRPATTYHRHSPKQNASGLTHKSGN